MTDQATGYETILYAVKDNIARLTLNRPEALNSFTGQMLGELAQAFQAAAEDEVARVLVITGAGRAFCAGQDLRANPESIADLHHWLATTYRPMLMALEALKKPTIALVNGVAAGAGFSLALACDFRVASTRTRFVPAFNKIALVPDGSMSYYLPRIVGVSRALELIGTSRELNGEEAFTWGLVNRVCPPEQLEETALTLAATLAQAAPLAYNLTRQMFHRSASLDLTGALAMEEALQGRAGASQDFKEGMAAFEEKRTPHFEGN